MRECGILLHISSLPGKGGCGTMGAQARRFIEFLRASGQSCWQVLPLTPPARGNSPYSSYSVFAGNPYFIDLPSLEREQLLPASALLDLPDSGDEADFNWCKEFQIALLRKSFAHSGRRMKSSVEKFKERNAFWLPDYAMFMALKTEFGNKPYQEWSEEYRTRDSDAIIHAKNELADEIAFWEYVQFIFYSQWKALKRYANARGIKIIGDMPIYVDIDSADVWANPSVFALDRDCRPGLVAGVPPDAFSEDGQLWGNPLYNWKYLWRTRYKWWTERMKAANVLYDSVRIDHFRAIASYWAIPAGCQTAKTGEWLKGPGMDFVRSITSAAPHCKLIAEDLGLLDDDVRSLLKKSKLPGMKILQFAFSTDEPSDYLPHNFIPNCVGYIGTHDNDTVHGWMKSAPKDQVDFARRYLQISDDKNVHWNFINSLYSTCGKLAVVQMQDILGLDENARMNKPGIAEGNWGWRMTENQIDASLAKKLKEAAMVYGRCTWPPA